MANHMLKQSSETYCDEICEKSSTRKQAGRKMQFENLNEQLWVKKKISGD